MCVCVCVFVCVCFQVSSSFQNHVLVSKENENSQGSTTTRRSDICFIADTKTHVPHSLTKLIFSEKFEFNISKNVIAVVNGFLVKLLTDAVQALLTLRSSFRTCLEFTSKSKIQEQTFVVVE